MDSLSSLLCGVASVSLASASHAISSTSSMTSSTTSTPSLIFWTLVGFGAAVSPLVIVIHSAPSVRGALSGAVLSFVCLLASPAAERLGAPAASGEQRLGFVSRRLGAPSSW